jgi:hypothetical protein
MDQTAAENEKTEKKVAAIPTSLSVESVKGRGSKEFGVGWTTPPLPIPHNLMNDAEGGPPLIDDNYREKKEEIALPASEDSKDTVGTSMPIQTTDSRFIPSWIRNIFIRGHRKVLIDRESQELEAFVLDGRSDILLKLPFGHSQLQYGLMRVLKRGLPPWDQYLALHPQRRRDIDRAIAAAKQQSSKTKTLVAIGTQSPRLSLADDGIVFFLSLGVVVEPIHVTDAVGRKFDVPFEHGRTSEVRTKKFNKLQTSTWPILDADGFANRQ